MIFALALSFALARIGWRGAVPRFDAADWFMADFRVAVYYPVRAFLDGGNPYDSASYLAHYPAGNAFPVYAPATLLLYLPFGMLPLPSASAAYFALTVILTLVLAAVVLRIAGWSTSVAGVITLAGVLLLSRPGHWNLLLGQVTLPVVFGVYAALHHAHRNSVLAGAGIALSLLKPTFGLPLIIALVAQGAWKAVLGGVGIAAFVNLPIAVILVSRAGGIKPFVTQVLESQARFGQIEPVNAVTAIGRIDLVALLSRLQGVPLGPRVTLLVSGLVLAVAVIALRKLGPPKEFATVWIAGGLTCCAVLLSTYHHAYDLLLMILPAAALARLVRSEQPVGLARAVQASFFGLLAFNYFTTESFVAAIRPGRLAWTVLSSLNGVALVGVFGLFIYEARRATSRGTGFDSGGAPSRELRLRA